MQANRTKTLAKFTWLNLGFSVNMKFKEDFKICQTTCIDCQHADSNYLHCANQTFSAPSKGKIVLREASHGDSRGLKPHQPLLGFFLLTHRGPRKFT